MLPHPTIDTPNGFQLSRRRLFLALIGTASLAACGTMGAMNDYPPIVFVHGNGDAAGVWTTTWWRFESNGWPRDRLSAVDFAYPLARDDDAVAQAGRSGSEECRAALAAHVDAVLARTGASRCVLIGNSRGGYAIRNYVSNGGAAKVSHVVLGGTPNHGVWADPSLRPQNEFNGAGPFLVRLNAPQDASGAEITAGVAWMTLRSDNNDKYAQPDGVWLGTPGKPTGVTFAGPELKGALNVVLPGVDHRETSFSPAAFAQTYRFITGRDPATTAIATEPMVTLDGTLSGLGAGNRPGPGSAGTNLPLVGARLEVYRCDANTGERIGTALLSKTISAGSGWGPLTVDSRSALEFVIAADGYATTHIYRSPFPRSSSIVSLRAEVLAEADRSAGAVVIFNRPRGYFGVPRDHVVLDGVSPPAGLPRGVAGVAQAKARLADSTSRTVIAEFNGESIAGRSWPTRDGHVTYIELH
ncbi:MAG: hypothetical protein JWQ11_3455 [Rhizobacter sp.]|nr:hypothetical protein [Rhizobacter sp.]